MQNFGQIPSFVWIVGDVIRDTFKRDKYLDVTLPLTVFRQLGMPPLMERILSRREILKA